MGTDKICPLYRTSEGLSFGKGIGYCDTDAGIATCEGDVSFCERLEALKQYLRAKIEYLEKKQQRK